MRIVSNLRLVSPCLNKNFQEAMLSPNGRWHHESKFATDELPLSYETT